ncbi:alpha/beta hydrolase [Sansalvadorimonas sp. 2012CJ34-2]|uniref:Alpha/beta hydrolase n=1 Tax=Parendozoicomonas callyspongiae TaxID=2942213 RepID=A0ABT0PL62_9GAMM|nr:alpha/beta hydrolase [Sansalvadorimonas sp. 2012CJ34-2]MCL6272117.1 alpha/beta hydrolase [Sansalvadorimonas sp. 2012CJ34-2]
MPISWVNGLPLFYRVVGKPGNSTPILLVHGLASSQRDWLLQLPSLCQDRQVILVDLRGHGKTGHNSQFSVPAMAEDLHTLMNELNIPYFDLMGISMGGMIAMAMASSYSGSVRRLILVNTAPSLGSLSPFMKCLLPLRRVIAHMPMTLTARLMLWQLLPGETKASLRKHAYRFWSRNKPEVIARLIHCLVNTNLWPRLKDIRAKTLVIRGEHDFFSPSAASRICRRIPDAALVTIRNSGHATVIDQPAAFNDAMMDFLQTS